MANRGVVLTTALSLVVGTIVFFGLWVGLVGNWAIQDPDATKEYKQIPTEEDDQFQKAQEMTAIQRKDDEGDSQDLSQHDDF